MTVYCSPQKTQMKALSGASASVGLSGDVKNQYATNYSCRRKSLLQSKSWQEAGRFCIV